jgi:hypothetical protein
MKSLCVRIELLADAAFPETGATLGSPRSLDFIPGSALLGALAANGGYSRAEASHLAWDLFHSGRVRFGNGLPLDEAGRPAAPVPLSLHVAKGEEVFEKEGGGVFLSGAVRNHARGGRDPGVAYAQVREGFVGTGLQIVRPPHLASMRTAIGEGGRARKGLLFHFDALAEGTTFESRINLDDGLGLAADFIERAFGDAVIRLGRSRSAELGSARVRIVDGESNANDLLVHGTPSSETVVLLAQSDVALRSPETLAPTQIPTPFALGLPLSYRWLPERSFLRVRTWSPYNGKRRRFDLERQVIAAGSVLTFAWDGPPGEADVDRLRQILDQGVGDYRQDGLGRLVLDPPLLAAESLPDVGAERCYSSPPRRSEVPDDELGQWLAAAKNQRVARERAFQVADSWARHLRAWPAIAPSQWRGLARAAAGCTTKKELLDALFHKETGFTRTGVGKTEVRWGKKRRGRNVSLSQELEDLIANEEHEDAVLVDAVRQLADRQARSGRESTR